MTFTLVIPPEIVITPAHIRNGKCADPNECALSAAVQEATKVGLVLMYGDYCNLYMEKKDWEGLRDTKWKQVAHINCDESINETIRQYDRNFSMKPGKLLIRRTPESDLYYMRYEPDPDAQFVKSLH